MFESITCFVIYGYKNENFVLCALAIVAEILFCVMAIAVYSKKDCSEKRGACLAVGVAAQRPYLVDFVCKE
ncbi:MAG: hypothetical protein U0T07_08675 [Chitinophagales bacterium]